ncbi:hypothetical protein GGP41_002080 [Bipolaris sorokiniana]|uniref:Uncharacterized protein n=1 Tax=Cochliobolus sativus TaxID=45130 RepID=A0A8H6E0H7_COCSA|nr:hypothetical protein GGP41_002080 [Bipolaris sorokiniana]
MARERASKHSAVVNWLNPTPPRYPHDPPNILSLNQALQLVESVRDAESKRPRKRKATPRQNQRDCHRCSEKGHAAKDIAEDGSFKPNSRVSMQNSPPNSPLYAKKTNKNNNNNNSSINKIEINKFNRMYTNTHATNNNNPYTIVSATTTISTANPKPKLPTSAPSKNATATSPSGPQTTSLFTAHYSADRD